MKAIQVKYLGATNTMGARIKAWSWAGSIVEHRDYAIDASAQAQELCERYAVRMDWHFSSIHFASLPNQDWVGILEVKK